tara:strand:- start:925 stop:1707 length:783 start_codon:yes stop_codon:yes gene_type:complete
MKKILSKILNYRSKVRQTKREKDIIEKLQSSSSIIKYYLHSSQGTFINIDPIVVFHENNKVMQTTLGRVIFPEVFGKENVVVLKDNTYKYHKFLYDNQDSIEQSFKFTVVRNPYSRVLSAFLYINKASLPQSFDKQKRLFNLFIKNDLLINVPNSDKEIECRWLRRDSFGSRFFSDAHLNFQHLNVFKNGEILVDKLYKIEKIDDHWKELQALLGFNRPLTKHNTTNKSREYVEYFSDESINIINEVYSNDFKFLDYKKL